VTILLSLLYTALNGIRDTIPVLLAAALHEAGHLCACLMLRVPIRYFRAGPARAVIGYDASAVSYRGEAWIAACGPLFGILGSAAVLRVPGHGAALFGIASLSLALFNLLPIDPLDGSVILFSLLCCRWDPVTVERIRRGVCRAGTVFLWMCACAVQLRCGGNLSLLLLSVYLLLRVHTADIK